MRRLLMLATCLGASGCGILGPDVRHSELEVAPYKALCQGEAQLFCLQVREGAEGSFQHLYETPSGFDFEWGVAYVILVEVRDREEVIPDASSVVRRLDRVISSTPSPAGSSFELMVPSQWLDPLAGGGLALRHEPVVLECAGMDCTELAAAAATAPRVAITLRFSGTPGQPLEVVAFRTCAEAVGPCDGA